MRDLLGRKIRILRDGEYKYFEMLAKEAENHLSKKSKHKMKISDEDKTVIILLLMMFIPFITIALIFVFVP